MGCSDFVSLAYLFYKNCLVHDLQRVLIILPSFLQCRSSSEMLNALSVLHLSLLRFMTHQVWHPVLLLDRAVPYSLSGLTIYARSLDCGPVSLINGSQAPYADSMLFMGTIRNTDVETFLDQSGEEIYSFKSLQTKLLNEHGRGHLNRFDHYAEMGILFQTNDLIYRLSAFLCGWRASFRYCFFCWTRGKNDDCSFETIRN